MTGRKHVINKVDYYSKLLLEAQREKAFVQAQQFNLRRAH